MDFSNILSTLTDAINRFTSSIPNQFFGIDTLYIGLGVIVLLLLLWAISKVKKTKPTRELKEVVPEEVEAEGFGKTDEAKDAEAEALTEEDGFMPSNIPEEAQGIERDESESEAVTEGESAPEPVPVEEERVQEAEARPEATQKTGAVVRKKRESTRGGRKISKADFADFSGKRILIAEDNLINQKVINGVLNESGIDVVMADDGQFVMDILENDSNFEIILMDAHMPRMDGFEATRAIRANPAYEHIVVVALSGDTAVDDIRHMSEAGMEEHLEKPLKMDALYDVMSMYYSMDEAAEAPAESGRVEELEIAVDINDVACLDYDLGLEICGNDEVMYKELLKEFFIGYKDSSKRMREALVKKDYAQAQAILVDVKGTASNLGAKQFIMITEKFLEALSKGETASYSQLFKDYQNYLLALLKSIQAAFKV